MNLRKSLNIISRKAAKSHTAFLQNCGFSHRDLNRLMCYDGEVISYKTYLAIKSYCDTVDVDVSILKNFIKV